MAGGEASRAQSSELVALRLLTALDRLVAECDEDQDGAGRTGDGSDRAVGDDHSEHQQEQTGDRAPSDP